MSQLMNRDLIIEYENGGQHLALAIRGLTRDDLMAVPIPGKWSIQHLVIHLADADLSFADRMRRIIAMDEPSLLAWDENKFGSELHYDEQDAQDAVLLSQVTRRQMARVLKLLPDAAFSRTGEHSQRGKQTLETVLNYAVNHLAHHLKFLDEKRKKLGIPEL